MSFSQTRFAFTFLSVVLSATEYMTAQPCDQCSHPRIALYDATMLVSRPTGADSVASWWTLQWPIKVARTTLRSSDPTRDCVTWLDGAMVNARDIQGGTLKFGIEYLNLPPDGEIAGADYILTGRVSGSSGAFTLDLTLETAVSREPVQTYTINFGYDLASQQTAGQSAAAAFMPLLQTIRNFEVHKRNTDVTIAMRALSSKNSTKEIDVTPRKTQINTGETIDVDVLMLDCDNVPLSNRVIVFVSDTADGNSMPGTTGGTIAPSRVTTDASGKATVKFTAGKTPGIGQIVAWYAHRKPSGSSNAFLGSGSVVIGQPPTYRWLIQASISEQVDLTVDTTWVNGTMSGSYHRSDQSSGSASITALVKNQTIDSSGFFFSNYEDQGYNFDFVSITGLSKVDYYSRLYEEGGLDLPLVDMTSARYRGKMIPGETGFEFHYPNGTGDVAIVAQCGGRAPGAFIRKYTTWFPKPHWETDEGTGSTSASVSVLFNENECSITKTAYSYSIKGTRDETVYYTTTSGPQSIRTQEYIDATVKLLDAPTAVEQLNAPIPDVYSLSQNFPNPFNPSTVISYRLPQDSKVVLKVFSTLGQEVATLVDGHKMAGTHQVQWSANVPSGIYFYSIQAHQTTGSQTGAFVSVKKMILLR